MSGFMSGPALDKLFEECERRRMCLTAPEPAARSTLYRSIARDKKFPYRRVYLSTYARGEYWDGLGERERLLHVVRALADKNPSWVFIGESAAAVRGWDITLSPRWAEPPYGLSGEAWEPHGARAMNGVVRRTGKTVPFEEVDGIRVSTPARAIAECCLGTDPRQALPLIESALYELDADAGQLVRELHRDLGYASKRGMRGLAGLLHGAEPRRLDARIPFALKTIEMLGFAAPRLGGGRGDGDGGGDGMPPFIWEGRTETLELRLWEGGDAAGTCPRVAGDRSPDAGGEVRRARFTFREACDPAGFSRTLAGYGVPREREILVLPQGLYLPPPEVPYGERAIGNGEAPLGFDGGWRVSWDGNRAPTGGGRRDEHGYGDERPLPYERRENPQPIDRREGGPDPAGEPGPCDSWFPDPCPNRGVCGCPHVGTAAGRVWGGAICAARP